MSHLKRVMFCQKSLSRSLFLLHAISVTLTLLLPRPLFQRCKLCRYLTPTVSSTLSSHIYPICTSTRTHPPKHTLFSLSLTPFLSYTFSPTHTQPSNCISPIYPSILSSSLSHTHIQLFLPIYPTNSLTLSIHSTLPLSHNTLLLSLSLFLSFFLSFSHSFFLSLSHYTPFLSLSFFLSLYLSLSNTPI